MKERQPRTMEDVRVEAALDPIHKSTDLARFVLMVEVDCRERKETEERLKAEAPVVPTHWLLSATIPL